MFMFMAIVMAVISIAGLVGVGLCWPAVVIWLLKALFNDIVWEMRTRERVVALTFDDGPDPEFTPRILEILERYDAGGTFFLVGERVRRFPEVAKAIKDRGHAIANHSDSWRRTVALRDDEFEQDLIRAEESVGSLGGTKFFRPAGGMIRGGQAGILRRHGYSVVLGSAYAFDPHRPPARYIQWAIRRGLRPGAIVVLHDSGGDRSNTVAALPAILESARKKGLRLVKLSDFVVSG